MILLIDIGNTRIKWAQLTGARPARAQAAAHAGWGAKDYARRLWRAARKPERLLISSVAGAQVDRALAAAARRAGIAAQFVRVPRRGSGVTVGYLEPWRLGVDRFVAAVGARELFPGVPLCVIGVGTAMTLDLLDARGFHKGGVIIPAPALMVQTLLNRTHGIGRRAQGGALGGGGLFGRSTRAAVLQGARYAAAATIDRAMQEARDILGRTPLGVLTGGGAGQVRPLVFSSCVGVADLVMRGLAVLSREPRSRS